MQLIMVSYVPLLIGEAGRSDLDPQEVGEAVDNADATVKGVVWLQGDDGLFPCLLMENAEAIAEHLKIWAEGEPEKWFKLALAEHGGLYGLALMPDFKKGVERFRLAYQLRNGLPLPKDAAFQILFKPLHFTSRPGHIFGQVQPHIGKKIRVCILETSDFDGPDTDFDKAHELGLFETVLDGPLTEYVVSNLKGAKDD